MANIWLTEDPGVYANFEELTVVSPRIINAYLANKEVTAGANGAQPTVQFTEIHDGILGREVYVIVETSNFIPPGEALTATNRASLKIQIKTGDNKLTGTANEAIETLNDTTFATSHTVEVGNLDALNTINDNNPYGNSTDFVDKAIFRLSIRPEERATFDTWAENIETNNTNLPKLIIEVAPDLDTMYVLYGSENNTQMAPDTMGQFMNTAGHEFEVENKIVYEIYHPENLFNTLGTHVLNGDTVRKRISHIENNSSTDVIYFFHNSIDNSHEICECEKTSVRRRRNGVKLSSTSVAANIPAGYVASQPAPAGGDAVTNYYYNQGADTALQNEYTDYYDIVSIDNPNGANTDYGVRRYRLADPNNANDLVPLIRMPDNLNYNAEAGTNQVRATFSYFDTARRYCNPACFAGFIGMLVQLNRDDVLCTGMCFGDATSYPSVTHPNGDSVDTTYYNSQNIEQLKVDAFRDHYFTNIYRGNNGWYPQLTGTSYSSGHNSHLHSGDFDLTLVDILNE